MLNNGLSNIYLENILCHAEDTTIFKDENKLCRPCKG